MKSMIDRRNFLKGVGVTLALPIMESQSTRALAAGTSQSPRRLVCIGNHLGFYPGGFFPKEAGPNFKSSPTLKPLDAHRGDFTVFSNLDHHTDGGHKGVHAFLSSIRKEEAAGFPEKNMTLDQAAAEHAGSSARFPSITAGIGEGTALSWTRSGVRIPPVNNPAHNPLFPALRSGSTAGSGAYPKSKFLAARDQIPSSGRITFEGGGEGSSFSFFGQLSKAKRFLNQGIYI